jgi:hypothetical protein
VTALTACGASTGKTGPTVPTGPRAEIAVADWLRMAGLADGRLEGIVGAGGNRQAALVGRHRPEGSRWVVVVASHAKQSVAVVPVVELPSRARPHVAKATLLSLAAGPKVLVRADVMFVEEQPPHGFATRTVIVGGERPIVLLDRLSEVGSDEAQKRALVSAADVDGDGRWELVFDEKRGREKKKVVYRLGDAGYETRDASLFLDP